jgi:hypothetical protein
MPATFTTINHGAVSTLFDSVVALRAGRNDSGFGTRTFTTSVSAGATSYADIYRFSNGTGAFQDTFVKISNTTTQTIYQQGRAVVLDGNSNPTNTLSDAGIASQAAVGTGTDASTTLLGAYATGVSYRSLCFKPVSGSAYGAHVYQQFNTSTSTWQTVLGEVFVKVENTPGSLSVNDVATSRFFFFDNQITRFPGVSATTYYDGPRWVYSDSPYTAWSGGTPTGLVDRTALYTRRGQGTSSYAANPGNAIGSTITTLANYGTHGTDYFARSCDPFIYNVWGLHTDNLTYKLAKPFVIRHKMLPIGTANSDIAIGGLLEAGTQLDVSPTEKYTSIGGSLYIRTT